MASLLGREPAGRVLRDAFLPERDELVAGHRVDAADRQLRAPDRPVVRGERAGARKVARGGRGVSGLVQVPGEPELRPRELVLRRREELLLANVGVRERT